MKILKLGNDYANAQNLKLKEVADAYNNNAASSQRQESEISKSSENRHDTVKGQGRKKKEKTSQENQENGTGENL